MPWDFRRGKKTTQATNTRSQTQQCPSYPDICVPPNSADLNCPDIPYRRFKVVPPDPHGFDRDGDGVGCER
ncbi:hypothetical protein [Nostoc flagelliforme]|nr:hypothetical protein [Nostoc flagelliforme]